MLFLHSSQCPVSTSFPLPDPSLYLFVLFSLFDTVSEDDSKVLDMTQPNKYLENSGGIKLPVSGQLIVDVFDRDIQSSPIV